MKPRIVLHASKSGLAAVFAGLVLWVSGGVSAEVIPQVSIAAGTARASVPSDVVVHVELANPTAQEIRLLSWHTPDQGLNAPLFDVRLNGVHAEYLGRHIKRAAPTAQDFIALKPGQTLVYEVDLSRYFAFVETGEYDITYGATYVASISGAITSSSPRQMVSNVLRLHVTGRGAASLPAPEVVLGGGSISFNGCDATRQSALIQAHASATTYADEGKRFFADNRAGSRYVKWFGSYNAARWSNVRDHYALISNAAANAAIHYDCTCTDSYFAYVYPNQPYDIYLCNAFWSAGVTGTDSRAGTLIHELSHFTVLGGTDDFVYGQTGAMNLAISNPAQATMNADNHEYFVENTPSTNDNAAAYVLTEVALDFSTQLVSTTSVARPITLTNSGDANLSVGTITINGEFGMSANSCANALIAAGASCVMNVTFSPQSAGAKNGSIGIVSNSLAAPATIPLSGIGVTSNTLFLDGFEGTANR